MITAVSLNPAIDRTIELNGFHYGGMNRVVTQRDDAGGKAVNMAATAARLGEMAEVVGVQYRQNGAPLAEKLGRFCVGYDYILREGEMRVNLKLLDTQKGVITEVNAPGTPLTEQEKESLTALILAHAQRADFLVLTGSLPKGCAPDYYAELTAGAGALGCKCVLDAEGDAMREGLKAHPYLIKPNQMELEMLVGSSLKDRKEILAAAESLFEWGVRYVAVSMGSEGALLTDGQETWFAEPISVRVGSTVGAGDAMVAGMTAALLRGRSLGEVLRLGVASATACVMTEGTWPAEKKDIDRLYSQIQIRKV